MNTTYGNTLTNLGLQTGGTTSTGPATPGGLGAAIGGGIAGAQLGAALSGGNANTRPPGAPPNAVWDNTAKTWRMPS